MKPTRLLCLITVTAAAVLDTTVNGQSEQSTKRFRRETQEARIIRGNNAPEGRYPWVARYIFRSGTAICGGSLVAPDLVLTNAHCFDGSTSLGIVTVGGYNSTNQDEGQVRQVIERIPHPDFAPNIDGSYNPGSDIAYLKLDAPVNDTDIAPVAINTNTSFPQNTGDELLILGWGSITNGIDSPLQTSDILQIATVNYVSFEDCAIASDPATGISYGRSVNITSVGPDWLCTQALVDNAAACRGDSGGPVFTRGANASGDTLIGVISGSAGGCDNPVLPEINQDVSFFLDWIRTVGCSLSTAPLEEWDCPDPVIVNLGIIFDNFPEEISWTLFETETLTEIASAEYSFAANDVNEIVELQPDISYTITIRDIGNDGLCCPGGSFSISQGESTLVLVEGNFGGEISETFTVINDIPSVAPAPISTTSSPTGVVSTPAPTIAPTVSTTENPTVSPTITETTSTPTGQPTTGPVTSSPTTTPLMTIPTPTPTEPFDCNICRNGGIITNPGGQISVPGQGVQTCEELEIANENGEIDPIECIYVQTIASVVCGCNAGDMRRRLS